MDPATTEIVRNVIILSVVALILFLATRSRKRK